MLVKTTYTYATHGIPLECDVYETRNYSPAAPVFLFFHSGGLVGGARICIPPWLAQVCLQHQWPLISASYRLLPQAGGQGLLKDASAAYEFARSWKTEGAQACRKVIVGGASAGFFMASLIAHHMQPPPAAMLCITGIPTFRHSFFNSAVLLTPEPIKDEDMSPYIDAPVETGTTSEYDGTNFHVDQLLSNGLKNPEYLAPRRAIDTPTSNKWERVALYDYYLHKDAFLDLVGDVDLGFKWAKEDPTRLRAWPPTIFIQGNEDYDVSVDVTLHAVEMLGSEKAMLCLADKQGHLFDATSFLEDDTDGMDTVRKAVALLNDLVTN